MWCDDVTVVWCVVGCMVCDVWCRGVWCGGGVVCGVVVWCVAWCVWCGVRRGACGAMVADDACCLTVCVLVGAMGL